MTKFQFRTVRWSILGAAVIVAPIAWYLGSPLLVNTVVSEPNRAESTGVTVRRGTFTEIDTVHKGEGVAQLMTLPDGQHVLRFDDFQVTNGPDLYVYLSGNPAPRDSRQLHDTFGQELGRLKGNVGGQSYELPAHVDLD
ncbi:MAG: DM13 domain-containing protein, partial [Chloroflexota bacterium]